ncbi:hypothetical protein [Lentzea sp. NBRC 102530]|uniref:hypothetical protein n=1 Tax=Lentzea sp. NBRC 102530 TaxID=3032201 RepID=UPI002556916E|nr:hypothetical protein [Lentzea sp. NBRC 102530]
MTSSAAEARSAEIAPAGERVHVVDAYPAVPVSGPSDGIHRRAPLRDATRDRAGGPAAPRSSPSPAAPPRVTGHATDAARHGASGAGAPTAARLPGARMERGPGPHRRPRRRATPPSTDEG